MRLKIIVAYFFIYFIWGANFISIYYAIQDLPPFLMVGSRFAIAGLILFVLSLFKNKKLPTWKVTKPAILQGFYLNLLGTTTLVWGQQFVPSGLASILVTTVPVWMVILDKKNRRKNLKNIWIIFGLILGISGVSLIALQGDMILNEMSKMKFLTGFIVIISGTFFWAFGTVYVKRMKSSGSILMNVAIQLLFAGIIQIIIGLLTGEYREFSFINIDVSTYMAMGHLIILSSVIGYVAYIWLLRERQPTEVGTHTFVNPVFAVFLGVILAGEKITLLIIIALVLVLAAVFLIRYHKLLSKR